MSRIQAGSPGPEPTQDEPRSSEKSSSRKSSQEASCPLTSSRETKGLHVVTGLSLPCQGLTPRVQFTSRNSHQVHLTNICDMKAWGKRKRMSERKQRGSAFISTEKQQRPRTRNTQVRGAGAGRLLNAITWWHFAKAQSYWKEYHLPFAGEEIGWERWQSRPAPRFWPHSSQPCLCLPGCPHPFFPSRKINLTGKSGKEDSIAEGAQVQLKRSGVVFRNRFWLPYPGWAFSTMQSYTHQKRAPPKAAVRVSAARVTAAEARRCRSLTVAPFSIFLISHQKRPPLQHYLVTGILQFPRLHLIWH